MTPAMRLPNDRQPAPYAPSVTRSAVAAAGGCQARSEGCTSAVAATAAALAHTRPTVAACPAARPGASPAPMSSTASQPHVMAVRWPSTTLWKRVVGCPGLAAITTAEGPSAAKSQGDRVARVIAPATRMRKAEAIGTQTESAAAAGDRAAMRRIVLVWLGAGAAVVPEIGAAGMVGVATVGVIIVGVHAVRDTNAGCTGRTEPAAQWSRTGAAGRPAMHRSRADPYDEHGTMSFLIIDDERFALELGETILGGRADELLAGSALAGEAPFAVVVTSVGAEAWIRALPGGRPVRLREHWLTDAPVRLRHGDRLTIGALTFFYGDVSAAQRTSPVAGVQDAPDPLAPWTASEGTAPTGGRLTALEGGAAHEIPDAGLSIGRDPDCGLVVASRTVSRRHAIVAPDVLGYVVRNQSGNGVHVNGRRIEGPTVLRQRDLLRVGDVEFRFEADDADYEPTTPQSHSHTAAVAAPVAPAGAVPARQAAPLLATLEVLARGVETGVRHRIERPVVQLGRAPHCDVTIGDDSVSGTHATLLWRAGRWELRDAGSRNGSYVDGTRITECRLPDACEIRLGNVKLLFRAIARAEDLQATRGIVGIVDGDLR